MTHAKDSADDKPPEKANRFYLPIGCWTVGDGRWYYNPKLKMSEVEQLEYMVNAGYCCPHRYRPSRCPICGTPPRGCPRDF